jgi:hypothetical protein
VAVSNSALLSRPLANPQQRAPKKFNMSRTFDPVLI